MESTQRKNAFFLFFCVFASLRLCVLHAEFIDFDEFDTFQEFIDFVPSVEELKLEHPVDDRLEESITDYRHDEIIAEQKNRDELIALAYSFSQQNYQLIKTDQGHFFIRPEETLDYPTHIYPLLERYLKRGGTIVDYGAGNGIWTVALADLVGHEGKVVAFEPHPKDFVEMFWNLVVNHIQNAELYCEKECSLDALELEKVALIRINADGKEDDFLIGASRTIEKCKPVLIVKMLGGIPYGWADRFVMNEYNRRLKQIEKLGYTTRQISSGEYLALPSGLQAFSSW